MQTAKPKRSDLTKSIVKHSFLEILNEKDYSKITVSEICECVGIHRTTFYSYYHRIDDVLKDIFDEIACNATVSCWDSLLNDKPLPIKPLCEYLREGTVKIVAQIFSSPCIASA